MIIEWGARELAIAIRARQVSCREVMQAYLAQIARLNPRYNAIVSLQDPADLLIQADHCDRVIASGASVGPLHGFPFAVKDMAATRGIPTTFGSPILKNNVPTNDAIFVERVKRAGAIIIGKTNTPEFGLGSHTYNRVFGTTANAYDPSRSAGGSSGGAAVALALRMLPVADGSDFSGSLRNPAGWNNVYGLRPSMGRVPSGPGPEAFYSPQFGTDGPMARSVEDVALLLSIMAGRDKRAPLSIAEDAAQFTTRLDTDPRGLRIAWLADLGGAVPIEPEVLALGERAGRVFESLGCQVEAATLGYSIDELWATWLPLRHFIAGGRIRHHYDKPAERALMKPAAIWEVEQAHGIHALTLYHASQRRTAWYQHILKLFERYDALMLPSAQLAAFDARWDWPKAINGVAMDSYLRWMQIVTPITLAGVPALGMPVGFTAGGTPAGGTPPGGTPIGMQLVGRPQAELGLLRLAYAYEKATEWTSRVRPAVLG